MDRPPPSPPSSSTHSSPRPDDAADTSSNSLSFDLSLDPSDPLNFLMPDPSGHSVNPSQVDTSSSVQASPSGWPTAWQNEQYQFGAYQQQGQSAKEKQVGEGLEYQWPNEIPQLNLDGMGLNMDMEFDTSSIDSTALQFDPALFAQAFLAHQTQQTSAPQHSLLSPAGAYPFSHSPEDQNQPFSSVPNSSSVQNLDQRGARRLSVTSQSSSSASGASLSSVNEYSPPLSAAVVPNNSAAVVAIQETTHVHSSSDKAMIELAQRAREIVGVIMALPVGSDLGQMHPLNAYANQVHPAKLPIPRLPRPVHAPLTPNSSSSNRRATTQPTPPSSTSSTPPPTATDAPQITVPNPNAKPKTSHTTIERRYRTNLNARIQSLRAAVPALRVLEQKDGNRVGNLGLKTGTRKAQADGVKGKGGQDFGDGEEDVVDERGFVDGVKVARKGSKANVLGKAVEYIRVLKKRELRLRREQDGMKTLLCGLVGGSALLHEWEREWHERYGGPETDEVEGEEGDAEADDENDDGDGDDDELEEDDGEGGKKRKRAKVEGAGVKAKKESAGAKRASADVPPQEKRKRGRPRKVAPAPPSTVSVSAPQNQEMPMDDAVPRPHAGAPFQPQYQAQSQLQPQPIQAQPVQYLLAAFALFSFLDSPVSFSSRQSAEGRHGHSGTVLGPTAMTSPAANGTWNVKDSGFGWRDAVQIVHLFVSVLLFMSIVIPWIPKTLRDRVSHAMPSLLKPFLCLDNEPVPSRKNVDGRREAEDREAETEFANDEERVRAVLVSALQLQYQYHGATTMLSKALEAQALRHALGVREGLWGLVSAITRLCLGVNRTIGLERKMLEQKAWVRLAELVAFNPKSSFTTRVQTYLCVSKYISPFAASVADLATLALVINPIWSAKGESLWTLARSRIGGFGNGTVCRPFEAFVLESMNIDDAAKAIANLRIPFERPQSEAGSSEDDGRQESETPLSPLGVLAKVLVREYIRKEAEEVFLQSVLGEANNGTKIASNEGAGGKDAEMRSVIAAGRSLDKLTVALVDMFDKVCNPTWSHLSNFTDEINDAGANEIFALLHAIVLYRRTFPSALLHLPSPGDSSASQSSSATSSSISISLISMPSPPPSPSRKNAALHLALRRALDSSAFDRGDELEDARDRVVDMLTSFEGTMWPRMSKY